MKKNKTEDSGRLREVLKFTLATKGLTISDLAKMHGMTGSSLCNAFCVPFPKVERIIVDVLNLPLWKIWLSRYKDGKPNRPTLWYQRKHGLWVKDITKSARIKRKISDRDSDE